MHRKLTPSSLVSPMTIFKPAAAAADDDDDADDAERPWALLVVPNTERPMPKPVLRVRLRLRSLVVVLLESLPDAPLPLTVVLLGGKKLLVVEVEMEVEELACSFFCGKS